MNNYQHLPNIMVHKWPLVKYIITSTMDDGFPLRMVEIRRKENSEPIEEKEEENHLHTKRKKKEPRRKVTIIKKKKNDIDQMEEVERIELPPRPNLEPGLPYMMMPVEEFHELLDENIFQYNMLERAWVHHVVRLPEDGLIKPVRPRRLQGSYTPLLGPDPKILNPRRKVICYYMDNTASAWNEDWDYNTMVDVNHEGLEGEPHVRSVIIKYKFLADDREENSEISGDEIVDQEENPEEESIISGNQFEAIASDSEDYNPAGFEDGDPAESDASEEVEKSVRDLAMKMVALYVVKDASRFGIPDGYRTLYKLFLEKENPHTLRQCQSAIRAAKSGKISKRYIASKIVQEILKLPAFAEVPQETLDYMVQDLDDRIPEVLPPGSHVFLYDGRHDGESTSEE